MIDTPSKVWPHCVSIIVPVGVLNDVRVKLSIDVDEPPSDGFFIGVSGVDMKIRVVHAPVRVIDIDWLRRNV